MSDGIAAPWYRWRGVALGHPAGIDVIGAEPSLLDEGCCRLESLAAQWCRDDLADIVASCTREVRIPGGFTADTQLLAELAGTVADRFDDHVGVTRAGGAAETGVGLSGLAAALAVDLVVADLVEGGAVGAKARVGGYRSVVGASPRHGGWSVPVATAPGSSAGELRLQRGAVATLHRPVRSSRVRSVTVVADHAWRAHEIAMAAARRCRVAEEPDLKALGEVGTGPPVAGGAAAPDECAGARLMFTDGRSFTVGSWHQMWAQPVGSVPAIAQAAVGAGAGRPTPSNPWPACAAATEAVRMIDTAWA